MDRTKILNKIKKHKAKILGSENFNQSAVLLPIVEIGEKIHILFEVRSYELRRQPGEICFPGGRVDHNDGSPKEAAIRETTEELGLKTSAISEVSPIDYLVSPFGMIVYPFVGQILTPDEIKPNPAEVHEVFTVPLSFFLENKPEVFRVNINMQPEENFPFDLIVGGRNYNWRAAKLDEVFFKYKDKVIWGLTARILLHFIELIREEYE